MSTMLDSTATALLTYALHSLAGCVVALAAARWIRRPQDRDILWKATLVAPLITATTATLLSALGRRLPFIDLGDVTRRVSRVPLPGREVTVRVFDTPAGRDVLRQVIDPVATTLSSVALAAAACCVVVALIRLAHRRRALARALAPRVPVAQMSHSACGAAITLTESERLQSPVAFGRAQICVPTEVIHVFDTAHREALVAHEVAHLERRDPLWLGFVELITACSAFQPVLFVVARALRRDVELICDEAAVRYTNDRHALIGALALLAAPFDARSPICGAATAYDGSPLVARAERIATLSDASERSGRRSAVLAIAVLIAVLCAAPVVSAAARTSDFPTSVADGIRRARAEGRSVVVNDTTIVEGHVRRTVMLLK